MAGKARFLSSHQCSETLGNGPDCPALPAGNDAPVPISPAPDGPLRGRAPSRPVARSDCRPRARRGGAPAGLPRRPGEAERGRLRRGTGVGEQLQRRHRGPGSLLGALPAVPAGGARGRVAACAGACRRRPARRHGRGGGPARSSPVRRGPLPCSAPTPTGAPPRAGSPPTLTRSPPAPTPWPAASSRTRPRRISCLPPSARAKRARPATPRCSTRWPRWWIPTRTTPGRATPSIPAPPSL